MLRQKQLLLILDNFEHLLVDGTDAVDLVAALIGAVPGVQLIVSSRERLKLRKATTCCNRMLPRWTTTAAIAFGA
jgi:hypothetical protein